MNKKIILLITISFLVLIGLLFLILSSKKDKKASTDTTQNTEFIGPDDYLPPIPVYNLPPIEELEKDEKLTLQNDSEVVNIENPYKIAQEIITPQNLVLYSDEEFDILFFDYSGQKSFLIDLHGGTDFVTTREKAESKFLEILKIDKTQACLIRVSEGVSEILDFNLSGKSLGLSFCPSKNN